MKKSIFLLALALMPVLTGCLSTRWKTATQTSDVAGIWTNLDFAGFDPAYLILRNDGTYTIAPNPEGIGGNSGNYWFENKQIFLSDAFCTTPETYQVKLKLEEGQPPKLVFTAIGEVCRGNTFTTRELIWVGEAP
ncbi:MAG: hypothetical protein EDM79_17725 [Chloroflexi bacterium]|nr:MAG: hypothetical protein EDM79_17725 [Chloroflexota bacterium]